MQIATEDVVRPTPMHWLRYAYLGSVPAENETWVLYDATSRTWVLRHIARYVVLVAPIVIAVLIFLPAPFPLRALSCLTAFLTMMIFYLGFITDSVERRVEKAGYTHGTAARIREKRGLQAQRDVVARGRARREARLRRHSA
jgi:membrane protein YdbS with pleckstrin-like domain